MKFGRIFPPSPDFLNQCGFRFFLSPESSPAARGCCVSSGTSPSKGLDNSEEQIRKLVPPCGNITASSQPNATLVQPSKQRCWLMSEAKTNKAKDNFNGASIKVSKTQRKQGACVWSYAEKQGNSNRGRGYDFLLPKRRRKTSRHKSGSLHHPSELTGNKPSSRPAAHWQCSCWLQGGHDTDPESVLKSQPPPAQSSTRLSCWEATLSHFPQCYPVSWVTKPPCSYQAKSHKGWWGWTMRSNEE